MRATVGPLPSAVYWRRRAVVLGAVLLGIIVLFVSCSGGDDKSDQRGKGAGSSSLPTPAPAASSADTEPSFLDGNNGGGPSLPNPGDLNSQSPGAGDDDGASTGPAVAPTLPTNGPATGTGNNTNVTAPADGSCTDAEMAVLPIPAATTLKRGAPVEIGLKVKNIGTRTCSRDVGAGPQELYIVAGAYTYWSSDGCNQAKTGNVLQFAPGVEREYKVSWNGRQTSSCAGTVGAGPAPPAGQFELFARLGTLVSKPVTLTVVA
ncbi:adhesin [Micromonosporaceae bacterium Da 78-11]